MKKLYLPLAIGLVLAVLIILAFIRMFSVQSKNESLGSEHSTIQVTATFYPLAEFAQRIGQDKASVHNLTPAGVEPHDFEPTPQDLARLQQSNIFIFNGAGLEQWVEKLDQEFQQNVQVNTSQEITLLAGDEDDHDDHQGQDSEQHLEQEKITDPHIWLDPVLAMQQVELIAKGFIKADPQSESFYNKNAVDLKRELTNLNIEFQQNLAQCETRDIVTSHNAFQYLAKRYGLNVESISGLSPDEEPSAKKLAEVVEFVRDHNVKYIFFETLVSPKLSETIAEETGAQTIAFSPLEGLSQAEIDQGKNYFSVQRENLAALRTALGCK